VTILYSQPIILDLANDVPHDIASGDLAPGNAIRCGNRTDIPKKQRTHQFQSLGIDVRNGGTRGFIHGEVFACQLCGADKFKRPKEIQEMYPE
jgi:hypothetical protein